MQSLQEQLEDAEAKLLIAYGDLERATGPGFRQAEENVARARQTVLALMDSIDEQKWEGSS